MKRNNYLEILESELIPALGCTEPIAIAYAAAKSRQTLGVFPEHITVYCSGNVVKNVKGVTVPNSGGLKGIDVAAVLGTVNGDADKSLEVLKEIRVEDIQKAQSLIADGFADCVLIENVENLYVRVLSVAGEASAEVTIVHNHTFISEIKKDGELLYEDDPEKHSAKNVDKSTLNLKEILEFADTVEIEKVKHLFDQQIHMNTEIALEGLKNAYGAQIGRTLIECEGDALSIRARAMAAAGSDARMGGCSLPVVINSGSGNQGITVSLPVIEYAKAWFVPEEKLYRALVVSNLVAIYQKYYIGSLSAFCGVVTAGCGAGAAITYMKGGTYEEISRTIINTLANTSGIICDGAKASCAAKIASAVEAALMAHNMSMKGIRFRSGDGVIQDDAELTIQSVGHVGRVGMKETDLDILKIMLGEEDFTRKPVFC